MLEFIKEVLWYIAIIFLLGSALYYSFILRFPQINFFTILKKFFSSNSKGMSAFQTLSISLAARIGVGSLAGVALAIYIGGPGTIFWMWVIGIITAINVFCETYLGLKYNEKDENKYIGGPAYYIDKGIRKKKLAKLYAIFVIVAYIFGFLSIQANTIAISVNRIFDVNIILIGVMVTLVSGLSIIKGLQSISNITSKLVPIMGGGYILLSLFVIVNNIENIPHVIKSIFYGAWNIKSLGIGAISVFIIGMQRGIFCTESGLGTGAIATSSARPDNKVEFSLGQILGIYFTVFIVCTATAIIILTTDYTSSGVIVKNGIELTQYALKYHLNGYGEIVLLIMVLCLTYSTIVAGYYYGESNLKYLIRNCTKTHVFRLKVLTLIILFASSIVSANLLWEITDIFIAILAIINMYAIIKMRKEIICAYKEYIRK